MQHNPGFLKIVENAKKQIREITVEQARERLKENPNAILIDVREDNEWQKAHAAEAIHLGKGVLERDIEEQIQDKDRELIMYCGGGFRSALTAEAAQRMGYTNVYSLAGGFRALQSANWPMKSGDH